MDSFEAIEHELAVSARSLGQYLETQLQIARTVDPLEKLIGDDGEIWDEIGVSASEEETCAPYRNENELANIRKVCRALSREHPFAICGHENRISYTIGEGHTYTAVRKADEDLSDDELHRVQMVVDQFVKVNKWHGRQQENLLRRDRDGETILRKFPGEDGIIRVRYVEPNALFCPDHLSERPECSFGIETDPDDLETVLFYWVNEQPIEASEIQHRRRGLDSSCKRGIPIFWAVRHNLKRALKILRNGSSVTELQTAIGMIRKFVNATGATVQAWANTNANIKQTSDQPGFGANGTSSRLHQRYGPGTILNVPTSQEYEFPAMGVDPSRYIDSLQAELRAVAARLVMPEFMFTAKSDDQNRAAAFAAEGPSVKMFLRLQWSEIEADLELFEEQLDYAVQSRLISERAREAVEIQVQPPTVATRNRKEDAEVRAMDMAAGILSVQTATGEAGYDYEQEQANIEAHDERNGILPGVVPAPPLPMADDEGDEDDDDEDENG